jgi:hypothetical protein
VPRYWRYVIAALVGLATAAVFRGTTIGLIAGVVVALTLILIVESRQRAGRRP